MDAIPKYLDASRQRVALLGMVVAETVCGILTPSMNLSFKLDALPDLDWLRKLSEIPCGQVDICLLENSTSMTPNRATLEESQIPPSKETNQVGSVDVFDSESDDDDPYFPVKSDKDKTPHYIHQAIKLIKSDSPEDIELGLESLEKLVMRASDIECSENVDQVCSLMLYLQDDYDLDSFEKLWCNVLISMCIREAEACGNYLCNGLFSKDAPLMCKLRSIRVLLAVPMILEKIPHSLNDWNSASSLNLSAPTPKSKPSRTSSYYSCLFSSLLLKRLSIYKNWGFVFEESHNRVLAQRLLNCLGILVQLSTHIVPLDTIGKYGLLLSSLNGHCTLFAVEIMQGIRVFLTLASSRSVTQTYFGSIEELLSIAKDIASTNFDEKVASEWAKISMTRLPKHQ